VDPSFAPAYSFIGQAYEQKRDYKKVRLMLTKAINFSGGSPKSTAFLGHVYAISGRMREAKEILQHVKEQSKVKIAMYHLWSAANPSEPS
jgi:Flp pilus assembly protein TadD